MNNQPPLKQVKIEKKHSISTIWFLPCVAALLGAWILFQHITHANVKIQIHFENAESIIVNKTKIRYKGVIVGTVNKIELDSTGGVNIIAEIESHAAFMLREKTEFWLVSPKASLTSISGLDTLFSGSYISLHPGDGDKSRVFKALNEQPISIPENALLVTLKSETAGPISVGTPLFFKKIRVGEVAQIRLDKNKKHIKIKAFIENKYRYLVKKDSKFWNISGLNANISRTGFDLKLDSITSLIAGGITFSSPENSVPTPIDYQFDLFENIDKTETGVTVELMLNNVTNLPKGAGILFKGHGIGRITDIQYSLKTKQFIAKAVINPQFSELISEGAQFWQEKTTLSFSKIANLSNIISGDYIAFLPPDSTHKKSGKRTKFQVLQAQKPTSSELTLVLLTEDASGLSTGNPVSYQGIKIGQISQLNFSDNGKFVETFINISNQYRYLINKDSQFYLLNGVNFKASLQGIKVQTASLENMLSGGVALYNSHPIKKSNKVTPNKKRLYRLYPSKELAKLGKDIVSPPLYVSLLSKKLPSVSEGSPVYYHKFPIGEVASFSINESGLIHSRLKIKGQYKHLIKSNSVFWNVSGFKVNAGLSGFNIQADSLLSIASGGIAVDFASGNSNNKYKHGQYRLFANYQQAMQQAQNITLIFDRADNLQIGSKLKLKGLVVGEVKTLTLNEDNKIQITASLQAQFSQKIARKNSRFWIVSSELSLSGVKNLATLISGGYINVSLGKGAFNTEFQGQKKPPVIALHKIGLEILLLADNAGSTNIGSPVYHRQIQIGEVVAKKLTNDASGVEIVLNIHPKYTHLIRENSIFWPASGFNLDIGITGAVLKTTSLTSLLKGGISMSTRDDQRLQPACKPYHRFTLKKEMNESWLKWKLAIPKP